MRLAIAVVALVPLVVGGACKYPEPPDQCDGYCAIFAIDRPLARPGDTITLEGNLDRAMRVAFPGDTGEQPALATYGAHRATVVVPANTTAGRVGARGNSNYTESLPFRATTFALELQPFRSTYEQTNGGRFLGARAGFARSDASVAVAGDLVYLIGGNGPGGLESTIDVAVAGPDGSLTEPSRTTATLSSPRAHHSTVVLAPFVYVIGGQVAAGPTDSVDGASLETGALVAFAPQPVKLTVPREGLATVVIGNYVYAIGGKNADGEVDYFERAPIGDNGELYAFEPIRDITLRVPRSGHTVAVVGNSLYVIGGVAGGAPVAETERFQIFPDAYLDSPGVAAGNLVTPRSGHASIVLGDSIYVIGGTGVDGGLASIEKAVLGDALLWRTLDTHGLGTARTASMLIQAGNHVFVVGGTDRTGKQLDTFERASIIGHSTASPNDVLVEDFETTDVALLQPRIYASTFVIGHTLYVIGGGLQSGPTTSIETATINPDGTLSAFTAAPIALNQARMAHASFVYDNYYYVAGGRTSVDFLGYTSSVERAHIEQDGTLGSFQQIAFTLDVPRGYHTAVVQGRRLYVIGGLTTGAVFLDTVFTTPLTGTTFPAMTQDSVLPEDRAFMSMFVLPSSAFMFGGKDTATTYSIALQSIIAGDDLDGWFGASVNPSGREGMALVFVGESLYALGGVEIGALSGPERLALQPDDGLAAFDPSPVGRLVVPRYGHSAVTLGDHVYVLGGVENTPMLLGSVELSTIR